MSKERDRVQREIAKLISERHGEERPCLMCKQLATDIMTIPGLCVLADDQNLREMVDKAISDIGGTK